MVTSWDLTTTAAPTTIVYIANTAPLKLSGTWAGEVAIQRQQVDGTWATITSFASNAQQTINQGSPGAFYRPVFTTATSGNVHIEIG